MAHPQMRELDGRQLNEVSELPSSDAVVGELDGRSTPLAKSSELCGRQSPLHGASELNNQYLRMM